MFQLLTTDNIFNAKSDKPYERQTDTEKFLSHNLVLNLSVFAVQYGFCGTHFFFFHYPRAQ